MVVADTHILAWYLEGNKKLPAWGHELMEKSIIDCALVISSMTVYEMGVLLKKKRIDVSYPVKFLFDDLMDAGLAIESVDHHTALVADALEDIHRDPIDRIIAATSIVKNAPLITADSKLFSYPIDLIKVKT